MHLDRRFEVPASRQACAAVLAEDEILTRLFPDAQSEIVERSEGHKTVVSHYRALGQEGEATFHFDFERDGNLHFSKVCDGRVWKQLDGTVRLDERGGRTRVTLEMDGQTKALVPEFTIRGPMNQQIEQMTRALRRRLEALS
ncbi:MAG: hypothetical protein CL910_20835 [Deltaproteobacteria bacterium]|jgi:carbon monoxide dehydrogenase subunit G|nr:hypothetical protein [Deltaproteobacteria bacterium]